MKFMNLWNLWKGSFKNCDHETIEHQHTITSLYMCVSVGYNMLMFKSFTLNNFRMISKSFWLFLGQHLKFYYDTFNIFMTEVPNVLKPVQLICSAN